jgi:hypothetical protein
MGTCRVITLLLLFFFTGNIMALIFPVVGSGLALGLLAYSGKFCRKKLKRFDHFAEKDLCTFLLGLFSLSYILMLKHS